MDEIKELGEQIEVLRVEVARLEPGDIGVLRCKGRLTSGQAERLVKHLKAVLPEGARILVLDEGMELDWVRPAPEVG